MMLVHGVVLLMVIRPDILWNIQDVIGPHIHCFMIAHGVG